ncbi:TPA: hypothetical protein RQN76_000520, partial [Aeromonas dhakensis]|nr:hypothetical protein [Aeromonas dhakensis]
MSTSRDQIKFEHWQELRKSLKEYKRTKEYEQVIYVAEMIMILDKEAPFLRIMTPLFYKEIGIACENLGKITKAINNYQL